MNKIISKAMILLNFLPCVALAMNTEKEGILLSKESVVTLLSESKKQYKINAAQGMYVADRSNGRKQRLSALSLISSDESEKPKTTGYVASPASHVTIRRKTLDSSVRAKTLYDQALFLYPEKSCLNPNISIAQKIGFDESIKRGDVNRTVRFLNAKNGLKTSYPLAIKLCAVMVNNADTLDIHPGEAAIISVRDICYMAKSLAIFGHNEQFLENYARILHEDSEMRRIINGDR
jgi:hypothetical protein